MKYSTVLFDLDGTLTRSEEGITRCALYAVEKLGFTGYTQADFRSFIGPPLYESFRKAVGMTSDQADEAMRWYRERFRAIGWKENEVYMGVPRLLRSLHRHGCRTAIVTSKPRISAVEIAEYFGFSPYLSAIIGPDDGEKSPDKAEMIARALERLGGPAAMVGDRLYDVEGARQNGIDALGVTYGYGSREELENAGATRIFETVQALTDDLLDGDAPARGLFLSMEGMDGCGKTTQRAALVQHLTQRGWEVRVTREPGGDAIAEKIRDIILDPANTAMTDETEAYLYAASRAQNVRTMVLPELLAGHAVICDRFVDSSVAYQGGGRKLGAARIAALNEMATAGLVPDITVYLRMAPQEALHRRLDASTPDRLESERDSFFRRTFEAYEQHFAGQERVLTVDAGRTIPEVTAQMLAGVDERLASLAL